MPQLRPMQTGVYLIRNLNTGKIYVGSAASSFTQRWNKHRCDLNSRGHHNPRLQASWNKHGEQAFVFEILERCSPSDCLKKEQQWLNQLTPTNPKIGYNFCEIAGSHLGRKRSQATLLKMSKSQKGRVKSSEHRAKIAATLTGSIHTPETRAKLSAMGKGHIVSEQTRLKISLGNKGNTHSTEFKAKISSSLKKYFASHPMSNETKKRMSESRKGRVFSVEVRAKMSVSAKHRRAREKLEREV